MWPGSFQKLNAVHLWHSYVAENEGDGVGLKHFEPVVAVVCFENGKAVAFDSSGAKKSWLSEGIALGARIITSRSKVQET